MPNRTAVMETNRGIIRFELDEENAPITAGNFIGLAERGFYNGLTFHRYVENFVIQGGMFGRNWNGRLRQAHKTGDHFQIQARQRRHSSNGAFGGPRQRVQSVLFYTRADPLSGCGERAGRLRLCGLWQGNRGTGCCDVAPTGRSDRLRDH